jgi:nitrogenase molybdenum-iron protein alpha/beta subunit
MIVTIKENSWIAKLSAKQLGSKKVAVVVGRTIHLFNTTREEFLKDEKWVCHELAHVEQFQRHGLVKFLALYLVESIKKGYRMNRYELEAKSKERNPEILLNYVIA